jgi:hypothetical protein
LRGDRPGKPRNSPRNKGTTMSVSHTHQSFEAARDQAAEFLGFTAGERIVTNQGSFEIPNPSLLDEDQQAGVDALDVDMDENWDRHPDVLNEDGTVKSRGALKVPYRKKGEPVNYNTLLAKAIFGERYPAFKAAGGRPNDLAVIWSRMNQEMAARRDADNKSGGSADGVAAVADADRVGSPDPLPAADSGVAL